MHETIFSAIKQFVSIAKDKITIDPLYLLLVIEEHHDDVIDTLFYKKFWQSESILCADNFDVFTNLLWSNTKTLVVNHPFYVYFMGRIVTMKLVKSFWTHVDATLEKPSKQLELITINSAISIVRSLEDKSKDVMKILTPNFLKMLATNGTKSIRDEDVQEMYKEFYELLDQRFIALKKQDVKLQMLRVFTQSGSLTVEKSAAKKFISNLISSLELDGLTEAINDIKSTIISDKDERERQYAASIFQKIITGNKLVCSNIDWRIEQLIFLVNLAIFKSPDGVKLSKKDEDANSNANNIRNIFYHCLEYKLPNLEDEKTVLLGIVSHIEEHLSKKNSNEYLQKPLQDAHIATWRKMFAEATAKADKKDKKLKTVFQVLLLHMGLQLFNHSDVAANAITELEAVTKRALQKKSSKNEPDWIEVVIDLFLTLLSQESHVLRNVIRHVFPQLCSQMTVTAFHQILSLLDLNSKENPLQVNGNASDDEDEDEDMEDDESGSDEESEEELENGAEENGEESDAEMEDLEDADDENVNDTFRLAVQSALGAAGGDADEVDLDDMDDAEGEKLDMALAAAFKMLKQNRKSKPTKADKIAEKTLLHFRMRALDLIEIYLKNNPQMEICLETLIFFYDLMPIAIKNEKQSPLLPRFDGIFIQLAQLKSFSLETVANVTSKHLAETLTNMLQKTVKEKTNIQQLNHFPRACIFLINCSQILQKLTPGEDEVLRIMLEHLREFFTHRNPTLQLNSFNKILATQWNGNFKMAKFISDEGLRTTVRSLRRTQSLQMLKTFFKNNHLFVQNDKHAEKYSGKVCDHLKTYTTEVQEVPQPELLELIQFVLAMRQQKLFTAKDDFVTAIQKFRVHHQLKPNILSTYKSFCNVMKVPFVPNENAEPAATNGASVKEPQKLTNGHTGNGETTNKPENRGVKRKKNANKEKKLKKQERLAAASKGFNTSFTFANTQEVMLE